MAEDFDNHRRMLDSGDDLQAAAAVRAVFNIDVEDPFEQPGPTHARRRTLRVRVIACGLAYSLWRTGNDFTRNFALARPLWIGSSPHLRKSL